jgi:hypothetical protein
MSEQTLTMKDVLEIIRLQSEENRKAMLDFAVELKKPTAEQQKKIDEDKARLEKQRQERVYEAKIEEESRTSAQSRCAHVKKDGKPAWGGGVNGDGYVRPMCTQCFKIMPEIKAPMEWIQSGVNFQDKELFPILTEEMLVKWHHAFGGPKPIKKRTAVA